MALLLNPVYSRYIHYFKLKSTRLLVTYKKLFIVLVVVLLTFNFLYFISDDSISFEFDEEYLGTYKEKYLRSIKNKNEIHTDSFYYKLKVMGFLDDLVNEPIEQVSFNNSIDPFELLDKEPDFNELPLEKQADLYYNSILSRSNFLFKPVQETIHKDVYHSKKYLSSRLEKWLKIKKILTQKELSQLEIDDDLFKSSILNIKNKKIENNKISSNEIKNSFTHLKFFSKFFLKNDQILTSPVLKDLYPKYSALLFPWLTTEYPTFKKYNKLMKEKNLDLFGVNNQKDSCFIKVLQSNLSGRGIVITATNGLIPELSGLLAILRITGNTLPIQIVHNNDLSLDSIKKLNELAIEPVMRLPASIPEFKVPKLPNLDLTFVDVSRTINPRYKGYYGKFGMKLLAYLFNSFEDMIMLDTDSVPLLPISDYFQTSQYLKSKTLFFRDREANSFLYNGIFDFFTSYLNYDHESHYLQIPRTSDSVLSNRFFGEKARHFMEAGLFLINKKEKFDGVLSAVEMQMFKLFTGSLHGEKEFIWLGQEIMGESYIFNSHSAISIGELSPMQEGIMGRELCSTHPGHIDDDGKTLLWFNSGFLTCKKPLSYYKDSNYARNAGKSLIDLKKEYLSPLHIANGLIPPPAEYTWNLHNGEPTRGWFMTSECENYLWCAYDIIGGDKKPDIPKGEVINFDQKDVKKWDYFGRVWVNYFNIGSLGKSDNGVLEDDAVDELGLDELDVFEDEYLETAGNPKAAEQSDLPEKMKTGNRFAKGGFAKTSGSLGEPSKESAKIKGKNTDDSKRKGNGKNEKLIEVDYKKKEKANSDSSYEYDFIDETEDNSGLSKGFKETDSDSLVDNYEDNLDNSLSKIADSEKKKSDSDTNSIQDNFNNILSSFGFGSNQISNSKLSSFADDSSLDLDTLAEQHSSADDEDGGEKKEVDLFVEGLVDERMKQNKDAAVEEQILQEAKKEEGSAVEEAKMAADANVQQSK